MILYQPQRYAASHDQAAETDLDDALRPGMQVLAKDFWSNLTEAVQDLCDVVEIDDAEAGQYEVPGQYTIAEGVESYAAASISSVPGDQPNGSPSSLLLLRSGNPLDQALFTREALGFDLLSVYQHRFDAVFKVLHWPTARALIERSRQETSHSTSSGRILEAAVFFAAACTLKPHEAKDKENLLRTTRGRVESCLASADFVVTTNLVVLQAFVIYLVR